MKWVLVALSGLLLVAGICFFGLLYLSQPRFPAASVENVNAAINIHFDQRMRPFVRAESWPDAYFAQGWLHAKHRLWQMELLRRAGHGRLAQALGPSLLPTDIELVKAGVPDLAQQLANNASPRLNDMIAAYVQGVNSALREMTVLPPELLLLQLQVAPWRAEDVFALGALMAFQSGNNLQNELLRMSLLAALGQQNLAQPKWQRVFFPLDEDLPDFPYVLAQSRLPAEQHEQLMARIDALDPAKQYGLLSPRLGSNGWAVAPANTASGHALFAFDSHDGFSMPNLTYDVHLFVGPEQIRGTSVPGLLGVINGFNEFMAWGFTNIGDSQDLFVETLDPNNPQRMLGRKGWYEAQVKQVTIPVRDAPDHQLELVATENGRLWSTNPPLSLQWSALHAPAPSLDALLHLNRVTSFDAFNAAMDEFAAPSANATYADVEGRVAFRTVGVLPKRGSGRGLLPLSGHALKTAWQGIIAPDEMPRSTQPETRFVAAANARVHNKAPLISADNAPGYRIARIQSVLANHDKHSAAGMQSLQTDWFNMQAVRVLPPMLQTLRNVPDVTTEEDLKDALEILGEWLKEPINDGEARAPLLFAAWYRQVGINVFSPVLGDRLTHQLLGSAYIFNHALDRLLVLEQQSPWWRQQRATILLESLKQVLSDFDDTRVWQDLHQVQLRHELSGALPLLGRWLDSGPHPWGGGNPTVGRARYSYQRPYTATGGATVRLVIEMSQPMQAAVIMPGGQSGHFLSPHYDNQTASWLAGELDVLAQLPEQLGEPDVVLKPAHPP